MKYDHLCVHQGWFKKIPWLHGQLAWDRANPGKIKVLLEMNSLKKPKKVMSLVGRVAALSRFVSRATNRCAPFFDVLKESKRFE